MASHPDNAYNCFHLQPLEFGTIQYYRQSARRDSRWAGAGQQVDRDEFNQEQVEWNSAGVV